MPKAMTARDVVAIRREDLAETVESIRQRITALQAERKDVEDSPVTEAEALERVDHYIAQLAEDARQKLSTAPFFAPTPYPASMLFAGLPAPEAVAALFAPETMRAALRAHVAEHAEGLDTLPAAGRPKRLAEIDAAIHAAEVEEEQTVEASEDLGVPITRRPDASPAVVLGWTD